MPVPPIQHIRGSNTTLPSKLDAHARTHAKKPFLNPKPHRMQNCRNRYISRREMSLSLHIAYLVCYLLTSPPPSAKWISPSFSSLFPLLPPLPRNIFPTTLPAVRKLSPLTITTAQKHTQARGMPGQQRCTVHNNLPERLVMKKRRGEERRISEGLEGGRKGRLRVVCREHEWKRKDENTVLTMGTSERDFWR